MGAPAVGARRPSRVTTETETEAVVAVRDDPGRVAARDSVALAAAPAADRGDPGRAAVLVAAARAVAVVLVAVRDLVGRDRLAVRAAVLVAVVPAAAARAAVARAAAVPAAAVRVAIADAVHAGRAVVRAAVVAQDSPTAVRAVAEREGPKRDAKGWPIAEPVAPEVIVRTPRPQAARVEAREAGTGDAGACDAIRLRRLRDQIGRFQTK